MDSKFKEFLTFERMISPILIQLLFWLGVLVSIVSGIWMMFTIGFFHGLWVVIFAPLGLRLVCETTILFFRMYGAIEDIKQAVTKTG